MRHTALAALAAALLLGCTPDRPKLPSMPEAFAALPLPPDPEFLGRSGSADALMFTFRTPMGADTVAMYYDGLFKEDTTYHVMNTTAGAAGEHGYYLEYKRRPIWLRIRPEAGNEGSIVELTGAVVSANDTVKVTPPDFDTMPNGTSIAPRTPGKRPVPQPRP